MSLSFSNSVRMVLVRVTHERAVPLPMRVPNARTAEILRKSERGEDVHTAKNAADLFRKLDI